MSDNLSLRSRPAASALLRPYMLFAPRKIKGKAATTGGLQGGRHGPT